MHTRGGKETPSVVLATGRACQASPAPSSTPPQRVDVSFTPARRCAGFRPVPDRVHRAFAFGDRVPGGLSTLRPRNGGSNPSGRTVFLASRSFPQRPVLEPLAPLPRDQRLSGPPLRDPSARSRFSFLHASLGGLASKLRGCGGTGIRTGLLIPASQRKLHSVINVSRSRVSWVHGVIRSSERTAPSRGAPGTPAPTPAIRGQLRVPARQRPGARRGFPGPMAPRSCARLRSSFVSGVSSRFPPRG